MRTALCKVFAATGSFDAFAGPPSRRTNRILRRPYRTARRLMDASAPAYAKASAGRDALLHCVPV
ncbi:hypothetical protein GCM10007857_65000 [Bradyrhizobium iriomotense]|uniref:Uncharacterized protein n=1 Tax=Bradyrhizobium iriomotense TaxID=441950 RepID=A0ABQ6B7I1_9BRAD|nr:hypothetical protein GCM10007857_65000 [Bradyrhizobium iriomotense]